MGSISQPLNNTVSLIVTNEHPSSRIHLRNYIPVRLISYAPITDIYDAYLQAGGGGGFYIRTFEVQLSASSPTLVKAEYVPEGHQMIDEIRDRGWYERLPNPMNPDYFYLDPGEADIFVLELMYLSPGHYTFQIGVEYFHDGEWKTEWLNQDINALLPERFNWYDEDIDQAGQLTRIGECSLTLPIDLQNMSYYNCVYDN